MSEMQRKRRKARREPAKKSVLRRARTRPAQLSTCKVISRQRQADPRCETRSSIGAEGSRERIDCRNARRRGGLCAAGGRDRRRSCSNGSQRGRAGRREARSEGERQPPRPGSRSSRRPTRLRLPAASSLPQRSQP